MNPSGPRLGPLCIRFLIPRGRWPPRLPGPASSTGQSIFETMRPMATGTSTNAVTSAESENVTSLLMFLSIVWLGASRRGTMPPDYALPPGVCLAEPG